MAITFVGAETPVAADNADVDANLPAGTATGDFILGFGTKKGSTGLVDFGSGYSLLRSLDDSRRRVYGKIAGASEDLTPTVDVTPNAAGDTVVAAAAVFRGVDPGAIASLQIAGAANASAQDIAYTTITPAVDGCAVVIGVWKNDDWTSIDPDAQIDSRFTQCFAPFTTTLGNDASMALYYEIQTTATAVNAGSIAVTGGAAAISAAFVVVIPPLVDPEFDGTPTTDDVPGGVDIDFEVTANATVSAVAVTRNSSAPSSAQIHAGQNAAGAAALDADSTSATGGVPDTLSLLFDFPIADMYIAVGTHVVALVDEIRGPAADEQFVTALAGPYDDDSIFDDETETGNIAVLPLIWSPGSAGLLVDEDGIPYSEDPQSGWQYFEYREYDLATDAWVETLEAGDYTTYHINNETAVELEVIPDITVYEQVSTTNLVLTNAYFSDPEDQRVTVSTTGYPSGISDEEVEVEGEWIWRRTGTPANGSAGTYTPNTTVTDPAGNVLTMTEYTMEVEESCVIPVTVGSTVATAIADVNAVTGLSVDSVQAVNNDTQDAGEIDSSSPVAGTIVAPGTAVVLFAEAVPAPDVVGEDIAAGEAEFDGLGVGTTTLGIYDDIAPEDEILFQSVAENDLLIPGYDVVHLDYSIGPQPELVATGGSGKHMGMGIWIRI